MTLGRSSAAMLASDGDRACQTSQLDRTPDLLTSHVLSLTLKLASGSNADLTISYRPSLATDTIRNVCIF